MSTKCPQKIPKKYCCEICDYYTSNKKDFSKHILTSKHKNQQISTGNPQKSPDDTTCQNESNIYNYECEKCKKKYKERTGLWRHKKICNSINDDLLNDKEKSDINPNNFNITSEMIIEMFKNHADMKQIILEQNNTIQTLMTNGINHVNSNNIISNNKSFNLNVFLNETCKNAMNIMDFANSIQPKLTDLENIGELGYVDGISKIIIDNLKLLDVSERPVHCSDFKRDVIYVRDANKWEKDNDALTKIKKVINCVANKNISLISEWKKQNPDCIYSDSVKSTKINKMIMEVMDTDPDKKDKIIKNIAKQVTIDKNK